MDTSNNDILVKFFRENINKNALSFLQSEKQEYEINNYVALLEIFTLVLQENFVLKKRTTSETEVSYQDASFSVSSSPIKKDLSKELSLLPEEHQKLASRAFDTIYEALSKNQESNVVFVRPLANSMNFSLNTNHYPKDVIELLNNLASSVNTTQGLIVRAIVMTWYENLLKNLK